MRLNICNMKHNFNAFLHQNKGFFVGSALAILSVIPLKSFANELNKASAATKAITEAVIVSFHQNISKSDSAQMWYNKGNAARNDNDYDEAIKCFMKAIELSPDHVFASYCLKNACVDGEKYYVEMIELNPNNTDAYRNLAFFYLEQGNRKKAVEYFFLAAKLGDKASQGWLLDNKIKW